MPNDVLVKFDRHGLGDCVQFAHLLQLYRSRGFTIKAQIEPNKAFTWKVAGVDYRFSGDFPDHNWRYPDEFDDLTFPDHVGNKTAHNIGAPPMPFLPGDRAELWDELCNVRLSAKEFISDKVRAEAERFIDGLPRPIICLHASGTNWRNRKSMSAGMSFDLITQLLKATPGSVVSLDWDSRDPVVANWRCRPILTNWGRIDPERLCALYELCDLMIGIDSGPFHLASFTQIPAIGMFTTDLHATRCCLPNPNAAYLVSDKFAAEWDKPDRLDRWNFWQYAGDLPEVDFIVSAASEILATRKGFADLMADDRNRDNSLAPATAYFFELIGEGERTIRLHDDRLVSGCNLFECWSENKQTGQISLMRKGRDIAVLNRHGDGCYRGPAAIGDRVVQCEMIDAERQPYRSFGAVQPVEYRQHEYRYTTIEQFKADCFAFARQLPPVRAVAGIPRSGLLAASLIALELNCPLISLESLLTGEIPDLPVPRRGRGSRYTGGGIILVVDDNCNSGRVIQRVRPKLHPDVKIAVIEGNEAADFYFREIDRACHQSYEWTLFHDDNAELTLTDMDGVLCEDWTGGVEASNHDEYMNFLHNAKPNRIPSYPLLGIVTNRLERNRRETAMWLERYGIQYKYLIMSPHETWERRDHVGDASARKAMVYNEHAEARLFVESCNRQSMEIHKATNRPVLSFIDNKLICNVFGLTVR